MLANPLILVGRRPSSLLGSHLCSGADVGIGGTKLGFGGDISPIREYIECPCSLSPVEKGHPPVTGTDARPRRRCRRLGRTSTDYGDK